MKKIFRITVFVISFIITISAAHYTIAGDVFQKDQVWSGTYSCRNRVTEFNLIIDNVNDNHVKALFHFTWNKSDNPYVRFGLFSLDGQYNNTDNSLVLKGTKILKSNSFGMIDLEGHYDPGNRTYSGNTSCRGEFSVKRSGMLSDFPKLAQAIYPSENTSGSTRSRAPHQGISGNNMPGFNTLNQPVNSLLTAKQLLDMMRQGKKDQAGMLYTQQYHALFRQGREKEALKLRDRFNLAKKAFSEINKITRTNSKNEDILSLYPIEPNPIDCIDKKIQERSYEVTEYSITRCTEIFNKKLSLIKKNRDNLDTIRVSKSFLDKDLLPEILEKINHSGATENDTQDMISSYADQLKPKLKELASDKKAVFLGLDISKHLSKNDVKKAFKENGASLESEDDIYVWYAFNQESALKDVQAICIFTKKKLLKKEQLAEIILLYPKYQKEANILQASIEEFGEMVEEVVDFEKILEQSTEYEPFSENALLEKNKVWNKLIKDYGIYHDKNVVNTTSEKNSLENKEVMIVRAVIQDTAPKQIHDGYQVASAFGGERLSFLAQLIDEDLIKDIIDNLITTRFEWVVDQGKVAIFFTDTGNDSANKNTVYNDRFYTVTYRNIEAFNKSKNTTEK